MNLINKLPHTLVKTRSFDILRRSRPTQPIVGFYEPPDPVIVPASLLISPCIKQSIIDILPEALRKRKVIRIFSNVELKEHIDGGDYEADEIVYNTQTYKVFRVGDWDNVNGTTFWEGYAVRATAKELSGMGA